MSTHGPEQQPPLDIPDLILPPPIVRFDPNQRRAFGSVPRLLGRQLDIPPFERLDSRAYALTASDVLQSGLLGRSGRNAVDGIVLNAEEFTAIVRSPEAFQAQIQAKTATASQGNNPIRAVEKELKSGRGGFTSKLARQAAVLSGLKAERISVDTLLEWQRVPGFSRSKEVDIVLLANQAWNGTISNMLRCIKDQHQLSPEDAINLQQALAYRLFRGPQDERVRNWGGTLQAGHRYLSAKIALFQGRQNKVERFHRRLNADLEDFYQRHDLFELS